MWRKKKIAFLENRLANHISIIIKMIPTKVNITITYFHGHEYLADTTWTVVSLLSLQCVGDNNPVTVTKNKMYKKSEILPFILKSYQYFTTYFENILHKTANVKNFIVRFNTKYLLLTGLHHII